MVAEKNGQNVSNRKQLLNKNCISINEHYPELIKAAHKHGGSVEFAQQIETWEKKKHLSPAYRSLLQIKACCSLQLNKCPKFILKYVLVTALYLALLPFTNGKSTGKEKRECSLIC